ncbi:MAG: hypothetical protein ACPG5T_00585 [Endozoicomonas sp.]
MAITNRILTNNRTASWLSRIVILAIVLISGLLTALISLQFIYQQQVDNYFSNHLSKEGSSERHHLSPHASDQTLQEDLLIIRTGNNWVSATGRHRKTYVPLLAKELGAYQGHHYIGWYASYEQWQKNRQLPFTLMYEVNYEKGTSQERFFFSGTLTSKLKAREIRLD